MSVVLATFNGMPFVEEQVRSILEQTRPPDELIITDDGSDDATLDTVRALLEGAAVQVRIGVNSQRLGPAGNFSKGIAEARGEIIVLADQDDRWRPDKLQTLEAVFRSTDVVAAFSNGRIMDSEGRVLSRTLWQAVGLTAKRRQAWDSGDAFRVLLRSNVITGAALAFRSTLTTLILPIPATAWHDHWIGLLAASKGTVAAVPDPLIDYRLHGTNTMGLPRRGWLPRARFRLTAEEVRRPEARRFADLRERLLLAYPAPKDLEALDEKILHLQNRVDMPRHSPARLLPVFRELMSGRYHRLAAGWHSAAIDLICRPENTRE